MVASTRRSGYTLTELMVTVAIMGTASSVGYLVMRKSFQAQFLLDAQNDIQQGAFTSFDTLTRLLRPATASSVVIDRYDTSQPPWSRITFDVASTGRTVTVYQIRGGRPSISARCRCSRACGA
ncbi:MAG: hypothetical protein FD126_1247 [Elusimicrobia bacterium]|nr:MAG: hypothetical protein FD126_1247 [Elusimicrobiota bacterium]